MPTPNVNREIVLTWAALLIITFTQISRLCPGQWDAREGSVWCLPTGIVPLGLVVVCPINCVPGVVLRVSPLGFGLRWEQLGGAKVELAHPEM